MSVPAGVQMGVTERSASKLTCTRPHFHHPPPIHVHTLAHTHPHPHSQATNDCEEAAKADRQIRPKDTKAKELVVREKATKVVRGELSKAKVCGCANVRAHKPIHTPNIRQKRGY